MSGGVCHRSRCGFYSYRGSIIDFACRLAYRQNRPVLSFLFRPTGSVCVLQTCRRRRSFSSILISRRREARACHSAYLGHAPAAVPPAGVRKPGRIVISAHRRKHYEKNKDRMYHRPGLQRPRRICRHVPRGPERRAAELLARHVSRSLLGSSRRSTLGASISTFRR